MNSSSTSSLNRRQLLRNGGLVLSLGAIVAACGDRGGSDAPGLLGNAAPLPTLPEATINDVVRLRTLQSLEYTVLEVYSAAGQTGVLTPAETALTERLVSDHTGHAALLGTLIADADGEEFTCANPFLMDRAVKPILAALKDSDDAHRDVLNIAHAFESLAGATYQALVATLTDKTLRRETMRIGAEEHRHAAALAAAINPKALLSPIFFGEPVEKDADGFHIPYAIPSTFGRLTGIDLVVGRLNEAGARFSTQLQTPADNTFVYDYQPC